ncbi:unnamed protein product [Didymodactylos carnosus]|uniref:Uncharacterized protein n=1 Tax=Didymodactylos carnosus TaxID=1234261 RepID=A0A8S2XK66_9BILA|nr:unnamed protein product [Didymodactylos carnosus]
MIRKNICCVKKVTRLQIPQNTTDELQPVDCYFNRQIKSFLKACYHRVALDELDIHLHERNNIIRLASLMHNQLSADVFTPMIKYAWFSSGLMREDPSPFVSVNQVCFASFYYLCSMFEEIVFSTLFYQLSFPLKTQQIFLRSMAL